MSLSFPIELKTATSPGNVISAVPAELCAQKKPGRERVGRKGLARGMLSPFSKPASLHSFVSNGRGEIHNTWEWPFSIFNLKVVLNT